MASHLDAGRRVYRIPIWKHARLDAIRWEREGGTSDGREPQCGPLFILGRRKVACVLAASAGLGSLDCSGVANVRRASVGATAAAVAASRVYKQGLKVRLRFRPTAAGWLTPRVRLDALRST